MAAPRTPSASLTSYAVDGVSWEGRLYEFDQGWSPDRLAEEVRALGELGPKERRMLLAEMVKIDLEHN
jgi:hypothetical protein